MVAILKNIHMTKTFKKKTDLLPLVILFVSAIYLLYTYFDGQILFMWKHIIGFIMLALTTIVFFTNHKLGVLCLGLTILLGLFGLLSFSPGIETTSIGKNFGDSQITILRFQPIFILWITIHFILSGRYYIGIANAKYWRNIKSDEPFKIE
jgi:hypothetical protein